MDILYKTVGSYTLDINVDDSGIVKPLVVHTKSNIVSISKDISNRTCSVLVLNDQLKEIKQVLLKDSKIVSINVKNDYTREIVSKGKITFIPKVIKLESVPIKSSVHACGSISLQQPTSTSENTFSASSTGTTIDDSMDSARIALLNEEDLFLSSGSKENTTIINSTNSFNVNIKNSLLKSTNDTAEPGENWDISHTFSELSSTTDKININVCIGDSNDLQYAVIGNLIYAKNQDETWRQVFDASEYLTEENSSQMQGRICTSSDGSYVLCSFSTTAYYDFIINNPDNFPKIAAPLFLSTDYGNTWIPINVPNVKDGFVFQWLNNPLMSKDGKNQTVAYVSYNLDLDDPDIIQRSGVYYSNDYGATWDYNRDPEFSQSGLVKTAVPTFYSSAMNYDGSIQYGFSVTITVSSGFSVASIFKSTDFGKSWKRIKNSLVESVIYAAATNEDGSIVTISCVKVLEDPDNPSGRTFTAFYSSDFCQTFTQTVLPNFVTSQLNSICMDFTGQYQTAEFDGTFYENSEYQGKGIIYSVDYGETWYDSDILNGENPPYSLLSNVATISSGLYQITGCVGTTIDSMGNTLYLPEIYDSDAAIYTPGETWALSDVASPEFTGFTSIIALGDFSDEQYLTTGPVTYKLVNDAWDQVFSFSGTFHVLATSGDGKYVTGGGIAPSNGGGSIYVSSDFGKTWEPKVKSEANTIAINALAMSKTGEYQTAVYYNTNNNSGIYYSTDYGETWNASDGNDSTNNPIQNITMNASGKIQYGCDDVSSSVWASLDYGKTWANLNTFSDGLVTSISTNSEGNVVSIITYDGYGTASVYVSLDYGTTTWKKSTISTAILNPVYTDICMSSSGQYQSLAYQSKNSITGSFYTTDFGVTWFESDLNIVSSENNATNFFLSIDSAGLYEVATTRGLVDGVLTNNQVYISQF